MKIKYLYSLLFFSLIQPSLRAQFMQEKINKIGVKTGISLNMLFTDEMNKDGAIEQYRPVPRQGLMIGVYSRNRLTKVIKFFDYKSNVKNWYFQYELNAAYRGGNFRYYAQTKDDQGNINGYSHQDTGRFRKISTFVIEMPFMMVWDYKNKQKFNLMLGMQPHYIVNTEVYKANDPSPLYYADERYDDLVKYKRFGWGAVAGFQIMGDVVGFQMLVKYGTTNINKRIVIGMDPAGNINRTIPGRLIPFTIDFNMVF